MLRECSAPTTCRMSCVTCHMSCVTFHVSHVTCHVSCVTCFLLLFFLQSGEAYWWRVCYQQGLPRLVFLKVPRNNWGWDATFSDWPAISLMFRKNSFEENKYIWLTFSVVDPPCLACLSTSGARYWKFLWWASCLSGLTSNLLKSYFFKIPDVVHRPTVAPVVGKNRR